LEFENLHFYHIILIGIVLFGFTNCHFDVLSAAIPARKGLKGGFSRLPFRKRIGMDNPTKFPL
jgi:hypothetical protein